MPAHIVIVEDDPITRRRLSAYLSANGYRVTEAPDADTMEQIIDTDPPELLIVDINLDGKDGLTITREQRSRSQVGIILLTSRDDQIDRIVGLEMGADDYVTKPFDKRELLARVKNLLTRIAAIGQAPDGPAPLSDFGRWRFDRIRRRLVSAQGVVPLTRSEFDLLHALTARPGITLSRTRLFEAIGQPNAAPDNRSIDVLVGRLRRKIEDDPAAPDWLLTVHGQGYVFADPRAAAQRGA
ncbi:response regulator [Paracoccus sp. p1-h21]|uniref:response regulator n=1 Tax=Paracoccus sp. p1-h21 TaxID=3366951 RepID=UPI0037A996FE